MNINKQPKLRKTTYQIGINAERFAIHYLQKNNWIILAKRFRCLFGEIDIIANNEETINFIEVKARKRTNDALYALTQKQQERITNAALYYLETKDNKNCQNIRFDLITVNQYYQIEHLKNIIVL